MPCLWKHHTTKPKIQRVIADRSHRRPRFGPECRKRHNISRSRHLCPLGLTMVSEAVSTAPPKNLARFGRGQGHVQGKNNHGPGSIERPRPRGHSGGVKQRQARASATQLFIRVPWQNHVGLDAGHRVVVGWQNWVPQGPHRATHAELDVPMATQLTC